MDTFGVTENHCLSSGSHRDDVSIPSCGPGFQNGAGDFRSISQYFSENDNTGERGSDNGVYETPGASQWCDDNVCVVHHL